jgi:hypothetical protein
MTVMNALQLKTDKKFPNVASVINSDTFGNDYDGFVIPGYSMEIVWVGAEDDGMGVIVFGEGIEKLVSAETAILCVNRFDL